MYLPGDSLFSYVGFDSDCSQNSGQKNKKLQEISGETVKM